MLGLFSFTFPRLVGGWPVHFHSGTFSPATRWGGPQRYIYVRDSSGEGWFIFAAVRLCPRLVGGGLAHFHSQRYSYPRLVGVGLVHVGSGTFMATTRIPESFAAILQQMRHFRLSFRIGAFKP